MKLIIFLMLMQRRILKSQNNCMLMAESQRRFKVVFAGLHNVQRFQGIFNQPLAHFGKALIQVGPLECSSRMLNELPGHDHLGYRFQDRYGPLRILSYTNYYPGLIQLFCQELLAIYVERVIQNSRLGKLNKMILNRSILRFEKRYVRDLIGH